MPPPNSDELPTMVVVVMEMKMCLQILDKMPMKNVLLQLRSDNPRTDPKFDGNSRVPFPHCVALISDELYKAKRNCKGEYIEVDNRNVQRAKDLKAITECTDRVNPTHILEPLCLSGDNNVNKMDAGYHISVLEKYDDPLLSMANSPKFGITMISSVTFGEMISIPIRPFMSISGDHDKVIPYLGTLSWIKALNFTVIDDWRPWLVDDQVVGYIILSYNYINKLLLQCKVAYTLATSILIKLLPIFCNYDFYVDIRQNTRTTSHLQH
ncbi:hypothetical protein Dsin_015700 [Dipteronia sinensis]|uniref:Uncharacterized protein n=1 Tax=Dipteronia sinensis TaxID=43782 RepID=A0AAE0E4X8_9ROSI|nr:hypothetical protein Dsin_015700 [Dipteronia sinensis]